MKPAGEAVANVMEVVLVFIAAVIAALIWSLDPVSSQLVIGALLSAELMVFSMAIYVYYRPPSKGMSRGWFVTGCATVVVFLAVALELASA